MLRPMTYALPFVLTVFLALPGVVHAHSVLQSSQPAQGATVETVPQEIVLTFAKDIRLTSVRMGSDTLDLPKQSGFGTTFAVPLPSMSAGVHRVEWRGLGIDGHAMTGTVDFTVR